MIQRITVSNYRSLGKDVRLELGQMTVLVGVNGSGKSNLVDVVEFLSDCMHMGLEPAVTKRHGIGVLRRWSKGRPFNLRIQVEIGPQGLSGKYAFELTGDRHGEYRVKSEQAWLLIDGEIYQFSIEDRGDGPEWQSGPENLRPRVDPLNLVLPLIAGDERFAPLAQLLGQMAVYSIYPPALRQPQKYDPQKPMDRDGRNWVSILKDQDERDWKPDLLAVLGKLTGDVVDVRIRPVAGYWTAEFLHCNEAERTKWFEAVQESDGTLRVAGIITALCQKPPPALVVIEEPELTVYPGALALLYDFFQQAASTTQVVWTTHSPDLLELANAEDVRVVERAGGATTVAPLAEGQREVVRTGLFTLGEVLQSEGLHQEPRQLALATD